MLFLAWSKLNLTSNKKNRTGPVASVAREKDFWDIVYDYKLFQLVTLYAFSHSSICLWSAYKQKTVWDFQNVSVYILCLKTITNKWTWNKHYLTQTGFLLVHCFPIGLPYRSVHSAHFSSTCSVSVKSFFYWRQKLLFRLLSGLLEFIVGKTSHGFGHCESKLWALLVLQALFSVFASLTPLSWTMFVPSWPAASLTWLWWQSSQVLLFFSPSHFCAFAMPPAVLSYLHHRWASCAGNLPKADISLTKSGCSSGVKAIKITS